jgi:hypothetical protein
MNYISNKKFISKKLINEPDSINKKNGGNE